MDKIFEITAKEVTIQVKDERTGVEYSRTLPMDYYENANVLKLSGENLDGSSSSIVFYSARGMERLKDLTGKGADHDPCGTHKPEDQSHNRDIFLTGGMQDDQKDIEDQWC